MRALTFIAPMGQAVIARRDPNRGGPADHPLRKTIENRPSSLPKNMLGRSTVVAVHCGKKWSDEYADTCLRILGHDIDYDRAANEGGNIIGLMYLSGRQFNPANPPQMMRSDGSGHIGVNPWFGGPYGYEITGAVAFQSPIPCRGMLGFWPVPGEVERQIEIELCLVAPGWGCELDGAGPP